MHKTCRSGDVEKKNIIPTMASLSNPFQRRSETLNCKVTILWSEKISCWFCDQCISVLNHGASCQHFQWSTWGDHQSLWRLPWQIFRATLVETLSSTFSQLRLLGETPFLPFPVLLLYLRQCRLSARNKMQKKKKNIKH